MGNGESRIQAEGIQLARRGVVKGLRGSGVTGLGMRMVGGRMERCGQNVCYSRLRARAAPESEAGESRLHLSVLVIFHLLRSASHPLSNLLWPRVCPASPRLPGPLVRGQEASEVEVFILCCLVTFQVVAASFCGHNSCQAALGGPKSP